MDKDVVDARLRDIDRQLGELRTTHIQTVDTISRLEKERRLIIKRNHHGEAKRWDVV